MVEWLISLALLVLCSSFGMFVAATASSVFASLLAMFHSQSGCMKLVASRLLLHAVRGGSLASDCKIQPASPFRFAGRRAEPSGLEGRKFEQSLRPCTLIMMV